MTRREALLAGAGAVVAAAICWVAYRLPPASTSDFEQFWIGARALMQGLDPYVVVPATSSTHYPLYYPLPAVLITLPLGLLPFPLAISLWAAVGAAVFVVAALRYRRGLLPALLSACFLHAIILGQWAPLLTAAVALPTLSWLWVAKPSVGLAFFVGYPHRRAVVGGLLLVGLAFLVRPGWLGDWLGALRENVHTAPIMRPGGVVLLLALLRWRRPEARVLAALACVPQTIVLYEGLPLFLIPRTRRQGYCLAVLSYVAAFGELLVPRREGVAWVGTVAERWPLYFCFLYLPALAMVLFSKVGADHGGSQIQDQREPAGASS